VLATSVIVAVLLTATDSAAHPAALIAFAVIAFTLAALAGEFVSGARARRAAGGGGWGAALLGVMSRNRRRYGGYIVHAGFAILLLGVAASSSFATSSDRRLRPGQTMTLAGYELRYRAPEARMEPENLTLTAVVDVRRDGRIISTLRPGRELFPADSGGIVSRYFSGDQTSEIGLDPSLLKDVWIAMQPDLAILEQAINEANRRFATSPPEVQAILIRAILQRWIDRAPPVTFRAFVRTGVSWIWMGAGVLGLGVLFAGWPARKPRPRHVAAPEHAAPTPVS